MKSAIGFCLSLLLFAPVLVAGAPVAGAMPIRGADHHVHFRSDSSSDAWAALCEAMPGACGEGLPSRPAPTSVDDFMPLLDEAGLEKASVLSIAYFFGFPGLADTRFNDPALVRQENSFVSRQVALYPDRLVGFFSVNPLADYALDEVRYWAEEGSLAGLKLHMANSDVDLANPEHLEQLAAIFQVLDAHHLAAVVHLRNRNPEYGYQDATAFIDKVLAGAPNVSVQMAHMAGWGGYDENTDQAVQAFLDALADGRLQRAQVYFDLAAVVLPNATEEQIAALKGRLGEIGADRLLFGTDWDALQSPAETLDTYQASGILDQDAWEQVTANQAPWLR